MSVSDLTNTTWLIKDASEITTPNTDETYYINFSDSNDYTQFKIGKQDTKKAIWYDNSIVLYGGAWVDESYRTITISGGTEATNSTLITWLQANATQQVGPTVISTCKVGNKNIIKKMYGIKEIVKEVLNGSVIYQK